MRIFEFDFRMKEVNFLTDGGSRIVSIPDVRATRLNNAREIRVYLPPGYDRDPSKRYPAVYMHVGQHAFESRKRSGESWNMHKVLDRLIGEERIEGVLLVAVDHVAEEGASEFFHDSCVHPIRCLGEAYEHFLIHELKPLIDRTFRTKPEPEHTALIGASAAGISAYTIGLRNPGIFGKIAALSPYFVHVDPLTLEEKRQYRPYPIAPGQQVWIDIGGAEGFFMPRHVRQVAVEWLEAGIGQGERFHFYHEPEAAHSETDWGGRAHLPLIRFFGKKGEPVRAALYGPDTVGIEGAAECLNAVVELSNGLAFSDLRGTYEVDRPDVLEVKPDGTIVPKAPGAATIRYRNGKAEAWRECRVVERLDPYVHADIEIEVPESTPPDSRIYATFEVPKIRDTLYGGRVRLPRGFNLRFMITRGYGRDEADAGFRPAPLRRLSAFSDCKVRFKVDNWMDLMPGAERGKGEAGW